MLKKVILIIICMFPLCSELSAQTSYWDSSVSGKSIKGLTTIAQSVITDSFNPMAHFKKGDLKTSFVPSHFSVKKVMDDPEIDTDDLDGFTGSLGCGYAVTDRVMVYIFGSYIDIEGTLNADFYGEDMGVYGVDSQYSLFNMFAGVGFDPLNSEEFSMPLYFGIGFLRYDIDLQLPTLSVTSPIPYTIDVDINDKQSIYSFNFGAAISWNVSESLRTSLFFLYIKSINKPQIYADVEQTGASSYSGPVEMNLNRVDTGMIGAKITFLSSRNWAVSVNAGSTLATLSGINKLINDGMELYTVAVTLSFTTNFLN